MNRLSTRIAGIQGSATLAVDAKAKALRAAGRPVIGFGAGEPDFPTAPHIIDAAIRACGDVRMHKYTPAGGLPELKEAIAQKTLRDSGLSIDPAEILITNGGKQAVYNAFAALLDADDEVILPAPYWTTYPEAIQLAGGRPIIVHTDESTGYLVTIEQLERARTEKTKVLLLCSPSNPTGAVYTRDQLEVLGWWALEHGIWVVTDEIYEHLVYDDTKFHSLTTVVPDLSDRIITVNGVAKAYAMTGWRVGWMTGPTDVIAAATRLQSHSTSNVCNVAQAAAVAALTGDQSCVEQLRTVFDHRRKTMVAMLGAITGISCPTPRGAFYVYPSVQELLGISIRGRVARTSAELAELLLDDADVAVVPGEAFGTPGYIRLSYALSDVDLEIGIDRIGEFLA